MRKLNHVDTNKFVPKTILHSVGGSMHNGKFHKNHSNFINKESNLDIKFDEYTNKIRPFRLEKLNKPLELTKEEKFTIRHLYESGKDIRARIWNELIKINGGKQIKCPLCGERYITELDHYVPREIYPEFSIHCLNLIPLCHDCNHQKGSKWLNRAGERLIFNAYFDAPTTQFLFKVKVNFANNFPNLTVNIDNGKINTQEEKLEKRTIETLELCQYYQNKANDILKKEILRIQERAAKEVKIIGGKSKFWRIEKDIYKTYANNYHNYNVSEVLVYMSMNDTLMEQWILKAI